MTIDDKIRDEKLQCDINREAAKISALSFRKIDKYEYFTGENILPSDQSRKIEQAKFTYSTLGKGFEKQIKTIEYQGKEQIKTLEGHEKQLVKDNNEKESSMHSKQKEIFEEIANANKRLEEIQDLSRQIDFNNLTYRYQGNTAPKNFIGFQGSLDFYRNIKEGYITLEKAEKKKRNLNKK